MINPFTLMHHGFIQAYQSRKTIYLVIQNFTLEDNLFKKEGKNYVLVSHYADRGKALEHYDKIKQDAMASFLDISNEKGYKDFTEMLQPESGFVLYSVLDSNPKATKHAVDHQLKHKIQKYIADKTNWHIPKNYEMIPELELQFGVLFVVLKFGSQRIKLPLSVLEMYK